MKQGFLSEIFVSFQGEGAHVGERHLFVRLAGCNIRCAYCDTPDSLERTATFTILRPGGTTESRSNPVDSDSLRSIVSEMVAAQNPIDAIAVTGGEPLVQAGFIAEVFGGHFSVPILLETNGMLPQRLEEVLDAIDIVSMDIKLPSNTNERPFWAEHQAFVDRSRGKELYIKILVDEGTSIEDVQRAAAILEEAGPAVPAFLQPINDFAGKSTIGAERLDLVFRCVRARHANLRVLPQTHKAMGLR